MTHFDFAITQNGAFEITVSSTLNAITYELLSKRITTLTAEHAPTRLLFVMSDLHGWTVPGMCKDILFDFKRRGDIDRVALVGDRTWQHGLAFLCRPLLGAQLRYYDVDRIDNARVWLEEIAPDEDYGDVPTELAHLLRSFASDDGIEREAARHAVAKMGDAAVPALARAGRRGCWQVRWEATKAMAEIGTESTIAPLVAAMHDGDDIQWIAAERLKRLGRPAVIAVLRDLIAHANSVGLCHGAHHMLNEIDDAALRDLVAPVVVALGGFDPADTVPVAANAALQGLHEVPTTVRA